MEVRVLDVCLLRVILKDAVAAGGPVLTSRTE